METLHNHWNLTLFSDKPSCNKMLHMQRLFHHSWAMPMHFHQQKGYLSSKKNTNKKPESKGGAYFSLCLSWFLFPASRCLWGIWKLECQRTPTSVFRPRELCRNFLRKLDAPIQELVKCTIEIQHYACHQNMFTKMCSAELRLVEFRSIHLQPSSLKDSMFSGEWPTRSGNNTTALPLTFLFSSIIINDYNIMDSDNDIIR